MAAGDKTWNSSNVKTSGPKKQTPLPAKEWDLKLKTDRAEIRKSAAGKVYINFYLEAMDSAEEEGGRPRGIYEMLHCGLNMAGRTDGVKGLFDAIGSVLEAEIVEGKAQDKDGNEVDYEHLDPQAVLNALKQFNGSIVRAKTKIEKGTGEYPDKAKVQYYIKAE